MSENSPRPINLPAYMVGLGQQARQASRVLATLSTADKNRALYAIADQLKASSQSLLAANEQDLQAGKDSGLAKALLDRLELNTDRIHSLVEGVAQIAALPDPIGEIMDMTLRPSGIQVGQMRVPLGVVGIIYESRPNVTADAAALCLKSGNAALLRGGSEAYHSNQAIGQAITRALDSVGVPVGSIQLLGTSDRAAVKEMVRLAQYIDVIVPRGGKGLIEHISQEARVPVIKHLDGICHVYIDEAADPDQAFAIALNAKTHRYGVCNAMETLLVAEQVAPVILPKLAKAYIEKGVELRGCEKSCAIIGKACQPANPDDWDSEYLAPILAIRVVSGIEQAIEHINYHGSGHTDSIVTENFTRARQFLREVDSSSVMVNASTRFADGFEYGLGAEIGISTDKFHARGPVGLKGLTSVKYIVLGDGSIRT